MQSEEGEGGCGSAWTIASACIGRRVFLFFNYHAYGQRERERGSRANQCHVRRTKNAKQSLERERERGASNLVKTALGGF